MGENNDSINNNNNNTKNNWCLLTCNAPTSGQLSYLPLWYFRRQHERDAEIRERHLKMDSYANAIRYSGIGVFDVLQQSFPVEQVKSESLPYTKLKKNPTEMWWKYLHETIWLTSGFCFHILNVRIWKLANCSSFTMPMYISPYTSVLSSAGGQYCMHITYGVRANRKK